MDPIGTPRPREAEGLFARLFPPVVSARDHLRRQARAFAAIAVVVALAVAFVATDTVGLVMGLLIAAALGARALFHAWEARRAAPGDQVVTRIDGLPEVERPAAYRRAAWMGGGACGVLSAWTAWSLLRLEAGAETEVSVWGPVAFVYERLGLWPAVLTPAAFGALIVFESWRKARQTRAGGGLVR